MRPICRMEVGVTFRVIVKFVPVLLAAAAFSGRAANAQSTGWSPAPLSDSLGPEITAAQRDTYHLFPDIKGFVSARFYTKPGPAYRLEYSYQSPSGVTKTTSRRITPAAWGLTRTHIALVETGLRRKATPLPVDQSQPEMQYRLALKLALPLLVYLEDGARAGAERAVVQEGDARIQRPVGGERRRLGAPHRPGPSPGGVRSGRSKVRCVSSKPRLR